MSRTAPKKSKPALFIYVVIAKDYEAAGQLVFLPAKLFYFRTLQDMSNALEEWR